MDLVDLSEEAKAKYSGETHFLRGLAYSVLAETYGGVPIILTNISTEEARSLSGRVWRRLGNRRWMIMRLRSPIWEWMLPSRGVLPRGRL